MGAYARLVNWFSTTPVGTFVASHVAARVDPYLYRLSRGRFTSTGPPTIPQLVLTTTGRTSGQPRTIALGYLADGADFVVVASNFGKERHPAWSHNLEAHPDAVVDVDGRTVQVRAERLDDAAKRAIWPRLVAVVPQFGVYVTRTDRNIRVYRLRSR